MNLVEAMVFYQSLSCPQRALSIQLIKRPLAKFERTAEITPQRFGSNAYVSGGTNANGTADGVVLAE
jgi:hypothetical protein